MEKILSVIIPTYNAEKFLDKGLTSFIVDDEKLLEKLEVIIVNDGTPDQSVTVAGRYADKYPDVFFIVNKENGGHGSAINEGMKHITGKYVKVVDADDWVDTKNLAKTIKILEKCTADAVIQSFRYYDISEEKYIPADINVPDFDKIYNLKELVDMWYDVYDGLAFHGVIYRTDFYKKLKYELVEHVFYEDQEYATVPLSYAETIKFIKDELYVYRIGDVNQSVSAQSQVKRLPDLEKVIFKVLELEKDLEKLPAGGREHWMRKTAGIITSYYHIALIKNTDRNAGRRMTAAFNEKLGQKSALMYDTVSRKYKIFLTFNKLHMSNHFYENQFASILEFAKKMAHVDRLYYRKKK